MRQLLVPILLAAVVFATTSDSDASPRNDAAFVECQALFAKRMPADRFWAIVEQISSKEDFAQQKALEDLLAKLPAEEVLAFDMTLGVEQLRAYRWDLWAVGYIANGGMSDDSFEYFRYWLISRGRGIFERVLADADSLADVVPANQEAPIDNEPFSVAAMNVWMAKTKSTYDAYGAHVDRLNLCQPYPVSPSGTKVASPKDSYPKTWKRFGNNPLH